MEVTLEANPDDLNADKLKELLSIGVNRLSIGIQSFDDGHLSFLNRLHNSGDALRSVKLSQDIGIENISIDLIYGIRSTDHRIWRTDLEIVASLGVPHISAYCLTIEEETVFGRWKRKGTLHEAEDEFSAQQFELLLVNVLLILYH